MTLKEQLLKDYKDAMIKKETLKKETLQICRAEILQVEKDKRCELTESDILDILSKEYKKRAETIKDLGDRTDIISKYEEEMSIIEQYLPKQLTEEEVLVVVKETIKEVGAESMKDLGNVMKVIQPKLKGKADGKLINNLVRSELNA